MKPADTKQKMDVLHVVLLMSSMIYYDDDDCFDDCCDIFNDICYADFI